MKTDTKSFILSVCIHLLAVGSAVAFAAFPQKTQAPILIDFTIESGQPSETVSKGGDPGAAARREPLQATAQLDSPPAVTPAEVLSISPDAVPVDVAVSQPVTAAIITAPTAASSVSPVSNSTIGATAGGTGVGSGADVSGTGGGSRGESAEALRERYLKKNFGYIRDLINSNLRYPGKARRMGWSGGLRVEFVVRENGSVDSIRIAKSSGVPLLDCNAIETVRQSAPFPKPPVSAHLIIPVEYVLE